jgi:hypothetical protein
MKNIYVLPTDKLSRLVSRNFDNKLTLYSDLTQCHGKPMHIDITSDEKIKEGDWYLYKETFLDGTVKTKEQFKNSSWNVSKATKEDMPYIERAETGRNAQNGLKGVLKIILTTDPDLIKDGVQAIDEEFLEWFINNSSCEYISVFNDKEWNKGYCNISNYKIIIPKEKQYLLERTNDDTTIVIEISDTEESKRILTQRVLLGLERELQRQKKAGKQFLSDNKIDKLIDSIIKEEMGNAWKESYQKPKQEKLEQDPCNFCGKTLREQMQGCSEITCYRQFLSKQKTFEEAGKDFIENTMNFSFKSLETKTQANRMLKCVEFGAKWQAEKIKHLRNELYNQLPTGEINAFDLTTIIKNHIEKLDQLI